MNKDILSALNEIDKTNPYATYLSEQTLSSVDGWLDTGCYVLNSLISGSLHGGIPKGRVTMLGGESMTGKSLFALKIAARAQQDGLAVVIFDTENAIDPKSAQRLGLDLAKVKYVPCFTIEETRNSIYKFLSAVKEKGLHGKFFIIVDSLGNLISELEVSRMEKDKTSADMGSRARAMKPLMQVLTSLGAATGTTVLCTNHVYDDPSAMFTSKIKNMPGGKSTIFLPSVTVQLSRKPVKSDGGKTADDSTGVGQTSYTGAIIRAFTVKNRFIKQYLEGEMYLSFTNGLDKYYGLIDLAVGLGAVIQTGSTYQLPNGEKLGYYKNFRKDTKLWEEKILPAVEERLQVEWKYNDMLDDDPELDIEE